MYSAPFPAFIIRSLRALRKYCIVSEKNWDDGILFVLFAACEAVQESLGFSLVELVFGHNPGVR